MTLNTCTKTEIFLSLFKEGKRPFLATCPPPSTTLTPSPYFNPEPYRKRFPAGLEVRARTAFLSDLEVL